MSSCIIDPAGPTWERPRASETDCVRKVTAAMQVTYVYIYIYIHMCIYIYIFICIHIYIYING